MRGSAKIQVGDFLEENKCCLVGRGSSAGCLESLRLEEFKDDVCLVHTAPDCASSGGPFFIGSLFVIMMYLRGYLVISEAT